MIYYQQNNILFTPNVNISGAEIGVTEMRQMSKILTFNFTIFDILSESLSKVAILHWKPKPPILLLLFAPIKNLEIALGESLGHVL
jgi:hypothetical protein